MSIQHQAGFWLRNINGYVGYSDSHPLAEGFRAFSDLMKTIFSDYRSYETSTAERVQTKIGISADDLENYHNLTETVDCLYQMTVLGVLAEEGESGYLEIEKAMFSKAFKGSVTFPFQMLEKYGFYFSHFKNGIETHAYKNCDKFYLFSETGTGLIPAMKHINNALPDLDAKEDYIGKKNLLFSMSDFESILLKNSTKQTDMSPLRQSILNVAGDKNELWHKIVDSFISGMKLTSKAYINPYVFPNWTVKFMSEKKTVITFCISPDIVNVHLPLSYDMAKNVIANKKDFPDIVKKSIENFGCMGCGKCLAQSNIEFFEGVPLCVRDTSKSFGESPRSIRGNIVSTEGAKAICEIVKEMT